MLLDDAVQKQVCNILVLSMFCLGRKTISWRTICLLIVLRRKQKMKEMNVE